MWEGAKAIIFLLVLMIPSFALRANDISLRGSLFFASHWENLELIRGQVISHDTTNFELVYDRLKRKGEKAKMLSIYDML
jgi:hypothetical protein